MSINNNTLSDEIELGKYLNLFWKGKFIIIGHILALLCIIAIYKYFSPPPIINFNTQVKPITSLETEYYNISNKIGLIKIFPSRDNIKEDISEETLDEESLTVSGLLSKKDVKMPDMVTVEYNGDILDRDAFSTTQLSDNDTIEFLYFMGGGYES